MSWVPTRPMIPSVTEIGVERITQSPRTCSGGAVWSTSVPPIEAAASETAPAAIPATAPERSREATPQYNTGSSRCSGSSTAVDRNMWCWSRPSSLARYMAASARVSS